MNAEALAHAAKACRQTSEAEMSAADAAEQFLHGCPDAGLGLRRVPIEMRDRAIGLKVASSFLTRCERFPEIAHLLTALESGADVYVVRFKPAIVVCVDENPATPPTLRERINALLPWRVASKAA